MSTRIPFIEAFLAGDAETAVGLAAPDVTFNSPVRSYRGVEEIAPLWSALGGIIEGVGTSGMLEGEAETAAFFAGTAGGQPVDGVLRVRSRADGAVSDVTLMLRPYASLKAAVREMARRLEAA
jgi:hypothetical protein